MKLKRLVLQGYKTFASKTEFAFDEGITAVVGPNGSGKSNVADALRWVLGEQSYSTLRGKRTTDMIFTGSQSRPRAGMAQAILTLDNSDGWLPIEYTEVEIGRRAYRSGENEYILNGQKVRLKDVLDLLATSGLAQRTYTVIGQGLIDQALSLRAEERRALFEEAAGINHYKAKRAETLRRLQETQQNLQRVHDILAEIRPRLTSLKRQATRAQNYEQVAADLRHLLRIWYGFKWDQARRRLRLARETAETAETNWQTSRQELLARQEKAEALRHQISQLQEETSRTQGQRDEVREQVEKSRREVAILQERQEAIGRQLAEIEQELPLLEQQQQQAEADLLEATGELNVAQANLQKGQAELRQFNATFESKQQEINRWQQSQKQAESKLQERQKALAQAEGQLAQLQERLKERQNDSRAAETAEMEQIEAQTTQLEKSVAAAQAQLDKHQARRQQLVEERTTLIRNLKQLRRDHKEQENRLNQQRHDIARLETRLEMLAQQRLAQQRLAQQDSQARQVADGVTVLGQLANFLTIPPAHRPALEAALGQRLATLLLPDQADLWPLLADDPQSLTAAVLAEVQPLPPQPKPEDTAVIGWANELVTLDLSGFEESALANLTGLEHLAHYLLSPILLVTDRRAAYRLALDLPPGTMAVAQDGFLVHAGGLVQTTASDEQDSILAREEAWREAQQAVAQKREELIGMETAVSAQQAHIQTLQNQVDEKQQAENRLGQLIQEANQKLGQAQRRLDQARQQQQFAARQQADRLAEVERLQARIAEMETRRETLQAELGEVETAVFEATTRLEALPIAESRQERNALRQEMTAAQTIVAGRQAVVDSRRTTLAQIEKQIGRLRERQESLQRQQAQIDLDAMENGRNQLQARLEQLDAQIEPLRDRLQTLRRQLTGLEKEMTAVQRRTHDLETQYTQTRIQFTQRENQLEGLQERIKADLGLVALAYDEDQTGPTPLPIGEVVEQLPSVDELPDDIEETIHNYRGQMQRMGAINPDAPQEYEETQTRYDFLTRQIEDLNETEAQLRVVIAELDDLTSRAFGDTVRQVNEVFGGTFEQLFGGGSAQLVLTDPDDLTISGVDIVARLPNRRDQPLALLSGGERSLTAAALIFSLLKVSPTPFCVMDEVDAALDEANINRFREMLRELSLKTQFVIITHNRGTIQAAQTIYGISMGKESVSEAYSINPEDYLREKRKLV
jgi:chromosome segregation protein